MHFQNQADGRTIFSFPIADISNVALTAKNEVSLETTVDASQKKTDALVDIRFFIPNAAGEEEAEDSNADREFTLDSAQGFVEIIKRELEAGGSEQSSSETIVALHDLPFIVPRGRYEMCLYAAALRLRGKSYDYKIPYTNIIRLFLLPRPDDTHVFLVIALDPPIRQGQTRYPFLVVQFAKDIDTEVDVSLPEEERRSMGLEATYEGPQFEVVSLLLKQISMKKLVVPGTSFQSSQDFCAIKCTVKANEGHLYFLEKSFLFVPKPAILIPHDQIISVTFSRVDTTGTARTFDVKFSMRVGGEQSFSSIIKEEFGPFEQFLREKGIRYQNELPDQRKLIYKDESDSSDDGDIPMRSGDEGEESSTDEDYQEGDSEASTDYSSSGSYSEDASASASEDE